MFMYYKAIKMIDGTLQAQRTCGSALKIMSTMLGREKNILNQGKVDFISKKD